MVNTHFSPLSGQEDTPGNYHTLTWTLEPVGGMTKLTLAQDNNASPDEAAHSKGMWDSLVESVKNIAERSWQSRLGLEVQDWRFVRQGPEKGFRNIPQFLVPAV
nr:SRPBCC domain-containing protein [Arthrobacter sp. efr-133-TYG-118]